MRVLFFFCLLAVLAASCAPRRKVIALPPTKKKPAPSRGVQLKAMDLFKRALEKKDLQLALEVAYENNLKLTPGLKRNLFSLWKGASLEDKVESFEKLIELMGPEDLAISEKALLDVENLLMESFRYSDARNILEIFRREFPESRITPFVERRIAFFERGEKFKATVFLPLTGRAVSLSDQIIEAAFDVFGKDRGWELEFLNENSLEDESGLKDEVASSIFVIGPLSHEKAFEVPERPVFITFTQKNIPEKDNLFRFNLSPVRDVEFLVNWAIKMGMKNFAAVYPDTNLGREIEGKFREVVSEKGGSVIKEVFYREGTSDFWEQIKAVFYPEEVVHLDPELSSLQEREECYSALEVAEEPSSGVPTREFLYEMRQAKKRPISSEKLKPDPIGGVDAVFVPDFAKPFSFFSSQLYFRGVKGVSVLGVSLADSPELLENLSCFENPVYLAGFYPYSPGEKTPILKVLSGQLFAGLKNLVESAFFSGGDPESVLLSSGVITGRKLKFFIKNNNIYPELSIFRVGGNGLVRVWCEESGGSDRDTEEAEQ